MLCSTGKSVLFLDGTPVRGNALQLPYSSKAVFPVMWKAKRSIASS